MHVSGRLLRHLSACIALYVEDTDGGEADAADDMFADHCSLFAIAVRSMRFLPADGRGGAEAALLREKLLSDAAAIARLLSKSGRSEEKQNACGLAEHAEINGWLTAAERPPLTRALW
jgi:hypothetical protein